MKTLQILQILFKILSLVSFGSGLICLFDPPATLDGNLASIGYFILACAFTYFNLLVNSIIVSKNISN